MKIDKSSYYPQSYLNDESTYDPTIKPLVEEKPTTKSEREVVLVNENDNEEELSALELVASLQDSQENWLERTISGISVFLSWVLVPLFMPIFGLLFAFTLSILDYAPMATKMSFISITALLTIGIPGLLIFFLKKAGIVHDIGLNGRKERLIPYIILIACYLANAWFFNYKGAPSWLVMFFVAGAVGGLVNLIINFWWKISAHAAGVAGVVAMLIRIESFGFPHTGIHTWLLISIICCGLLGSARIWLGRHTIGQVMAGYAVGFCSVLFLTLIQIP